MGDEERVKRLMRYFTASNASDCDSNAEPATSDSTVAAAASAIKRPAIPRSTSQTSSGPSAGAQLIVDSAAELDQLMRSPSAAQPSSALKAKRLPMDRLAPGLQAWIKAPAAQAAALERPVVGQVQAASPAVSTTSLKRSAESESNAVAKKQSPEPTVSTATGSHLPRPDPRLVARERATARATDLCLTGSATSRFVEEQITHQAKRLQLKQPTGIFAVNQMPSPNKGKSDLVTRRQEAVTAATKPVGKQLAALMHQPLEGSCGPSAVEPVAAAAATDPPENFIPLYVIDKHPNSLRSWLTGRACASFLNNGVCRLLSCSKLHMAPQEFQSAC